MFTLLEFECLGACDRAPVVMVNNEHWHETGDAGELFEAGGRLEGPWRAALSGCHLQVEK